MEYKPDMLSVDEARERVLGLVRVLGAEEKPLLECLGQVLAGDVTAGGDIPSLDNSAMDGYAVQYESVQGATPEAPRTLQVLGTLQAGQISPWQVGPGTAVHIMTGAPIPPGADTVIPLELTDERERKGEGLPLKEINVKRELPLGRHVRPAGEDIRKGEVVLAHGTVVRSGEMGVLASLGYDRVPVIRRPVVAILATGDEVVEVGQPLEPGRLYDSNSYGLAAGVLQCGGIPKLLGIARDTVGEVQRKLELGLGVDMLITSAGVSKGEFDVVKEVLAERGEITFWSIRMRPGKPLAFGLLQGTQGQKVPHMGLPGNPVSALVIFEEMVRPALLKMMGRKHLERPTIQAVLEEPIHNPDHRRVYARAAVTKRNGTYYARLTGPQGSNILTSMTKANGLAICPEDISELKKGEVAQVRMLHWSEESF